MKLLKILYFKKLDFFFILFQIEFRFHSISEKSFSFALNLVSSSKCKDNNFHALKKHKQPNSEKVTRNVYARTSALFGFLSCHSCKNLLNSETKALVWFMFFFFFIIEVRL